MTASDNTAKDEVDRSTIDGRELVVRSSNRGQRHRVFYFDVFEVAGDTEELLTVADPISDFPTEGILASLLTPRKRELARIMGEYRIVEGADYDHEGVYSVLYSPDPSPRYVAISNDETYSFFALTDDLDDACAMLAGSLGEESGGQIHGVWDLDECELIPVSYLAVAWPYSPLAGHLPWSPEGRLHDVRLAQAALARRFERRVIEVLSMRIRAVFPEAANLHASGAYNEDGLLKLTPAYLTRTDGSVVPAAATPGWSQVFEDDVVLGLLDDLSETHGDDYLGSQEIRLK